MLDGEKIAAEARTWIGVRFRKGGRDRTGIDCIGLLLRVGEAQGLTLRDTVEYTFNPEPRIFENYIYDQTEPLSMKTLRIGSILILKQNIFPMHTGILARDHHDRLSIINANIKKRAVVEEPLELWRNLLIGVRAYKE